VNIIGNFIKLINQIAFMKKKIFVFIILGLVCFNLSIYSQPGTLDASFGGGGIVTSDVGIGDDKGYSIIQQSDGKLVLAGLSGNGTDNDFGLVRYNIDGSLDPTFGVSGGVITPIGPSNEAGQAVIQQSDNKILVAGFSSNGSNNDFALVRYNVNGSLDNTFGVGGIVTTPIGAGIDQSHSIALQADGKILLAGFSNNGTNNDFAVVRYDTTGALDLTFDTDGIVTISFSSNDDVGRSIAVQTDGKIVVGGWSNNGTNFDYALARLNSDGSLDNTFDTDGRVTTAFGSGDDQGYSIAIQADGRILLAGVSNNGTDFDFAIARYNTNGSLDPAFDTDGLVTTDFFNAEDVGYSVAVQVDGKILMAGVGFNVTNKDFCLARYNPDGSLDNSFDVDGKVNTDIGGNDDTGWSVALQSDERVVVAGSGQIANVHFAAARYNICEIIDTTLFESGATLIANQSGYTYQWVNCDSSYASIAGETNQSFDATANGNYAVIISSTSCIDTSGCYAIQLFSISDIDFEHTILLYPNPTTDQLAIATNTPFNNATIQLVNLTGQIMMSRNHQNGHLLSLDLTSLPNGIYFLEMKEGNKLARTKVVKK
jgi:uncharacterized delta-60 repeat protein